VGHEFSGHDFGLQFEFTPIRATDDFFVIVSYRYISGFKTNFYVSGDGEWVINYIEEYPFRVIAWYGSEESDLIGMGRMTRVLILAKGDQVAIYLNDRPLAYYRDQIGGSDGDTGFGVSSSGVTEVDFDNVIFWRLEP